MFDPKLVDNPRGPRKKNLRHDHERLVGCLEKLKKTTLVVEGWLPRIDGEREKLHTTEIDAKLTGRA